MEGPLQRLLISFLSVFLAHLAIGHVSFCHHLASVVRLYREPSIDASYQVSDHLATQFQRRRFQKSTNRKQELPVATMFVNGSGRNEHSLQRTAHRCFLPSFGSFGQAVSEKNFKNQPIRNKSPVMAMFVNRSGRDEQSLQRRRFFKICIEITAF